MHYIRRRKNRPTKIRKIKKVITSPKERNLQRNTKTQQKSKRATKKPKEKTRGRRNKQTKGNRITKILRTITSHNGISWSIEKTPPEHANTEGEKNAQNQTPAPGPEDPKE